MRVFVEIEYGEVIDTDYEVRSYDCDITFKWVDTDLEAFINGRKAYITMLHDYDDEDAVILRYAEELFGELGLELNRKNARMFKGLVNGIVWRDMRQAIIAALLYQSYVFAEYFLI